MTDAAADNPGRITRISIHGFKSIKALDDLELRDVNVIVGANGAGKSNFIEFFELSGRFARREIDTYLIKQGGVENILYFGTKTTNTFTGELSFPNETYVVTITPTDTGKAFLGEGASPIGTPIDSEDKLDIHPIDFEFMFPDKAKELKEICRNKISEIEAFHFHDTTPNAPLKQNARIQDCDGLAADGRNLPAFLLFLKDHHPRAFAEIESAIRRVAPFFGHFILKPDPRAPEYVRLRWHHLGSDDYFDVSDLSDGTLRFIALATLLLQPDPPPVTVIDEPELGLHPFALHLLAGIMDSVKERTQIVCATQSVAFVNQFSWQDIIVAETPGGMTGGGTQLRRLSENEVTAWLDDFAMGELWEKNVIGGRP